MPTTHRDIASPGAGTSFSHTRIGPTMLGFILREFRGDGGGEAGGGRRERGEYLGRGEGRGWAWDATFTTPGLNKSTRGRSRGRAGPSHND
jgi:hypothetical protein